MLPGVDSYCFRVGVTHGVRRTASPADLNPDLGGGFVASARAAMVRLYERYNPEKVDEVDTLLTKWPGREAQLLSAVEARYSREEAASSPPAVPKPAEVTQ